MCNIIERDSLSLVYKRYASLYFLLAVDSEENELLVLEVIHRYVELLDLHFGNVCELDLIFNYEKAYYVLNELLMGGEVQETNKRSIMRVISAMDEAQAVEQVVENPILQLIK